MKAKDLFRIILKVAGLFLIKDVLISIPSILYNLHQMSSISSDVTLFSLFVSLLVFGIYFGIVYILLFKTEWLIVKLQLSSGFSDDPMIVNLHRSSVYTLAIIVSGLFILTFAIPQLISDLYKWYQYIDSRKEIFGEKYFDYRWLLVSISEVFIGLLFLGNQQTIVNFIELKRRQSRSN